MMMMNLCVGRLILYSSMKKKKMRKFIDEIFRNKITQEVFEY